MNFNFDISKDKGPVFGFLSHVSDKVKKFFGFGAAQIVLKSFDRPFGGLIQTKVWVHAIRKFRFDDADMALGLFARTAPTPHLIEGRA